jgi:hypothetical protein
MRQRRNALPQAGDSDERLPDAIVRERPTPRGRTFSVAADERADAAPQAPVAMIAAPTNPLQGVRIG